ncbi:hypothetical protein EDB81DRAFT_897139 [Dactylonectria macrodidyma]|uniref:NAD(P)-binding domain-containing protein n=1 Tax=Dactylonectria macrodidyma TaxID=307937 RepID=A0A9P9JIZ4_9HYPO|nr:hypothetical protein EDB81DRAFT_897139 [Dactylonectria macrodidyma]
MAGSKVLVLGATGPAGICLLRELLYRKHATIAYARTPSKIPADLASNPLLEVMEGEMDNIDKLGSAVAKCNIVLSLLGPNSSQGRSLAPSLYPSYYSALFPLMRQYGVTRIFAMNSASAEDAQDSWVLVLYLLTLIIRVLVPNAYRTMQGISRVFKEEDRGLSWTLFRLANLPGNDDEESWRKDREDGPVYAGYVGKKGYTLSLKRAALARWLVDSTESGAPEWIGKMPAVY